MGTVNDRTSSVQKAPPQCSIERPCFQTAYYAYMLIRFWFIWQVQYKKLMQMQLKLMHWCFKSTPHVGSASTYNFNHIQLCSYYESRAANSWRGVLFIFSYRTFLTSLLVNGFFNVLNKIFWFGHWRSAELNKSRALFVGSPRHVVFPSALHIASRLQYPMHFLKYLARDKRDAQRKTIAPGPRPTHPLWHLPGLHQIVHAHHVGDKIELVVVIRQLALFVQISYLKWSEMTGSNQLLTSDMHLLPKA